MKLVDLNVLLYVINGDAPRHAPIRSWWETALAGNEPVGLPWIVLLGFLRLATSASIFPRPLSTDVAIQRIDAWLSHPNLRLVSETENHWRILRELLADTGMAGNLTTDAHLAALAISHAATLVSCDADFARFRYLKWENPVSSSD